MKDKIFKTPQSKKFEFDEQVASVFDNMLSRSIPFYNEVQELIINIILKEKHKKVVDLGVSTAEFLLKLYAKDNSLKLKGIDNSKAMLEQAENKCKAFGVNIDLEYANMLNYNYQNEEIIISNYTFQFIRPIERIELINSIYNSLEKNGVLIFSEKVIFQDKVLDKNIIDIYYEYKEKQGYSSYEITHKREALENVLVPFTIEENIKMCKKAGFKTTETMFQWANFVTFIARKK